MIETIYLEEAAASHPRARGLLARHPEALVVPVESYGEVFNRGRQSFRLQERKPSLLLATKRGKLVHEAPYGIGGTRNFYFSHVLNCLYDCRYCFLQGMYRSAHYVLFVNYEDFQDAIRSTAQRFPGEEVYFFSGYDGDSLALESLTGFANEFLPFFERDPRLVLEIRTKSAAIRPLLARNPSPNCVVAFSFTPDALSREIEHGVPPVEVRVAAAAKLAERGWPIGLRFDPILSTRSYRERYQELFDAVFSAIPERSIHSVGFGAFRLPRDYFARMARLYPEEKLFAGGLEERSGMVSYPRELEEELLGFCRESLRERVSESRLFAY
jgi:spore photoproduct lyase